LAHAVLTDPRLVLCPSLVPVPGDLLESHPNQVVFQQYALPLARGRGSSEHDGPISAHENGDPTYEEVTSVFSYLSLLLATHSWLPETTHCEYVTSLAQTSGRRIRRE
jgi:hypothetical protein